VVDAKVLKYESPLKENEVPDNPPVNVPPLRGKKLPDDVPPVAVLTNNNVPLLSVICIPVPAEMDLCIKLLFVIDDNKSIFPVPAEVIPLTYVPDIPPLVVVALKSITPVDEDMILKVDGV
jgi:hypothetical protein